MLARAADGAQERLTRRIDDGIIVATLDVATDGQGVNVVAREGKHGARHHRRRAALRAYLDAISRYDLLTASGEHRLAVLGRDGGEDARRRLAEANLRLVLKIALDYRHSGLSLDELIAEGNVGLTEATRRFDPDRGVRFGCYAGWWIRKRIIAAIHRSAAQGTMPEPRSPGTPIMDGASNSPRRRAILSLEHVLSTSGELKLADVIADPDSVDADERALEHEMAELVRKVVAKLPPLEREILEQHYGLGGAPASTLRRIGARMGVTRERVRQIEMRAIEKTRRMLGVTPPDES